MKDIVIIGSGGFAREVAWLIEDINKVNLEWNILGFIDNNSIIDTEINGYKVIGNDDWLLEQEVYVVNAVGDSQLRKKIIDIISINNKLKYPILIHPSVIYSELVTFGEGAIICAGNILTVNIKIGKHVIINLDCTIGHDANIADFATVLPSVNISGDVNIKSCVSIGTGSAIIQGITIGENSTIGAGAVVVKDLPENCTAVGSPAKPIKFHDLK